MIIRGSLETRVAAFNALRDLGRFFVVKVESVAKIEHLFDTGGEVSFLDPALFPVPSGHNLFTFGFRP